MEINRLRMLAPMLTDGYKLGHREQYPEGTTEVYSNWTPRSNRHALPGIDKVLVVGVKYTMDQIRMFWDEFFFQLDKDEVLDELQKELTVYTGTDYDVSHLAELHDYGKLPIYVKHIPEGTEVPIGTPILTIKNTEPQFFWITNYLETLLSNLLWLPMNSATIALAYRRIGERYAKKTDAENVPLVSAFMMHDFSMRGMGGLDATIASAMGHAFVMGGSDSLPAIQSLKHHYNATDRPIITGVPATEHSVMSAGTRDGEIETFERLLDIYPTGPLSVVSDTWDLWKVIGEYLPKLKDKIMSRDGKLVIRPDSGDPVDIICGINQYDIDNNIDYSHKGPHYKGVIEILWDIFGGTVNEQGYKVLDPHIGAIYGDSITLQRAEEIYERLEQKGFASTNIVLGIGSFTYQYNTRDTLGFAMKATSVVVNGERREIFKDPVTDSGDKKSAKGLLQVYQDENGKILFKDEVTEAQEQTGLLIPESFQDYQFETIRKRIDEIA